MLVDQKTNISSTLFALSGQSASKRTENLDSFRLFCHRAEAVLGSGLGPYFAAFEYNSRVISYVVVFEWFRGLISGGFGWVCSGGSRAGLGGAKVRLA